MGIFKKILTAVLFITFAGTLLIIGRQVYFADITFLSSASVGSAGEYKLVRQLNLSPVEVRNYKTMGFTKGIVRFSSDGQILVVGTETGEVIALNVKGDIIWQKKAGVGKVTALMIGGNDSLYVGEQSPEGYVYKLDLATGRELWKMAVSPDVGSDFRQKMLPSVAKIVQDAAGRVYVLAMRYEQANNINRYYGKIYGLDAATGKRLWQFPDDHAMDAWVSWCSVDANGDFLVFGTANFERNSSYNYPDNIYCLSAREGRLLWSKKIEPVKPFDKTIIRTGPNLSADGRYIAAMASDGRAFLLNMRGDQIWRHVLSKPQEMGGVYLNAIGRDSYVVKNKAVFTTVNTYNSANWQMTAPVEHPSSNSVFVFSLEGDLRGQFKAGGSIEEICFAKDAVIAAVGRNTRIQDSTVHGVSILSLEDAQVLGALPSEGPAVAVAATPAREYIAYIEAPIRYDDGRITGAHRLYLWKK